MSETELRSELKTIVAEIIEIEDFNDDDNFVTVLGVDSMLALEIVARIEKRYRIRIPEDRFAQMQTLDAVVDIIEEIMQPVNS
jgi:acyl carrier protein